MATYCCDLGFDWNAVNNNIGPLQGYLMNKDTGDSPAWFTQFQQNDVLFFVLYDTTSIGGGGEAVSNPALTFSMTIQDASLTSSETPLNPTTYSWNNSNGDMPALNPNLSAPFQSTLPCYAVGPTKNTGEEKYGENYTFTTAGYFNFTAQVIVASGNTTHTYIFDPEMIVGPST